MTLDKIKKGIAIAMTEAKKIGGSYYHAVEDQIEYVIDALKDMKDMAHDEGKREKEMKPTPA